MEDTPDNNSLEHHQLAQQGVLSFPSCGIALSIDRKRGVYLLRFDKEILDQVGKEHWNASVKPLLAADHRLRMPDGSNGPKVRFQWWPTDKAWSIRYRFNDYDQQGSVKTIDGKPAYVNLHHQVQAIAQEMAEAANVTLSEKLGLTGKNR